MSTAKTYLTRVKDSVEMDFNFARIKFRYNSSTPPHYRELIAR